jgi:hypothetical protein
MKAVGTAARVTDTGRVETGLRVVQRCAMTDQDGGRDSGVCVPQIASAWVAFVEQHRKSFCRECELLRKVEDTFRCGYGGSEEQRTGEQWSAEEIFW